MNAKNSNGSVAPHDQPAETKSKNTPYFIANTHAVSPQIQQAQDIGIPLPTPNTDAILATLKVLFDPRDVIELRAIVKSGYKRIDAGYFDHAHWPELAEYAAKLSQRGYAVYITLNPVDPQLLSRYNNRIEGGAAATTTDKQIVRRRWLLIDLDPVRPSNTSATDEQLTAAHGKAQAIYKHLKSIGWANPVVAKSGNGYHLLYAINLPNDDATNELLKSGLLALANQFDDACTKVDRTVFNAARICKLYGTVANKGDHTKTAPWRLSELYRVPKRVLVTADQLRTLHPLPTAKTATNAPTVQNTFILEEFLSRHGLVYTADPYEDGERFKLKICPFNSEHVNGEAAIFRRATGILGFRCMHDSCSGKNWKTLRAHLDGPRQQLATQWDGNEEPSVIPMPDFQRTKDGVIKSSKENLEKAIDRPDVAGMQLRLDNFRDEIMLASPGEDDWRAFKDTDYTKLCLQLERKANGQHGFADIGKDRIRDVVALIAERHQFDSAQHWLESQSWDGVPRIEDTLINYFGTEDTPYHRAVGMYLWTALAGRVMDPGIKADMVPVAVGPQGAMKSSTVAAIAPSHENFLELDLGGRDDDLARLMRGKLVIELGELKGLRAKEMESVKSFITRRHESWVPKYKEMSTVYPRRCVFIGTTNKDEFLADDTGNRRWLPFNVGICNPDGMTNDRAQLWAEGLYQYKVKGIQWQVAERLANNEHVDFVVQDAWEDATQQFLRKQKAGSMITAAQVLNEGLFMDVRNIHQGQKDRMAGVLKKLGLKPLKLRVNGKQVRGYQVPESGTA